MVISNNKQAEHQIQDNIRLALSQKGFAVFRTNVGRVRMSDGRYFDTGLPKGFSDLIAIKDGKITFIEVKTPIGKASPEQINFIMCMKKQYGCKAGVCRSVEDAIELCGDSTEHGKDRASSPQR